MTWSNEKIFLLSQEKFLGLATNETSHTLWFSVQLLNLKHSRPNILQDLRHLRNVLKHLCDHWIQVGKVFERLPTSRWRMSLRPLWGEATSCHTYHWNMRDRWRWCSVCRLGWTGREGVTLSVAMAVEEEVARIWDMTAMIKVRECGEDGGGEREGAYGSTEGIWGVKSSAFFWLWRELRSYQWSCTTRFLTDNG